MCSVSCQICNLRSLNKLNPDNLLFHRCSVFKGKGTKIDPGGKKS